MIQALQLELSFSRHDPLYVQHSYKAIRRRWVRCPSAQALVLRCSGVATPCFVSDQIAEASDLRQSHATDSVPARTLGSGKT